MGLIDTVRTRVIGSEAERYAPVEYRDAVTEYYRSYGKSADLVWAGAPLNCWQVRIKPLSTDPRREAEQEGVAAPEEVVETVELLRENPDFGWEFDRLGRKKKFHPAYVAIELEEIGIEALLDILREGDSFSGRGRFDSIEEARKHARQERIQKQYDAEKAARQEAMDLAGAVRRQVLKIPFLPVGKTITGDTDEAQERQEAEGDLPS